MKLLFAYFDFTANGKGGGYRGFGECGLNFSISHDYKVERVALEGEGAPAYVLSRTEKPVGEKLPEEFWGKHIYNVSAIVGGNGLGKSTLIHCLINALYYEQKEEVSVRCPTLLVFETESGRERVLCRNVEKGRVSYEPSGGKKPIVTDEYPFDDAKARSVPKLMLFSNTFSSGDVALNRLYKNNDNKDQFFNKSLVASFKYSQEIRSPGELPKGDTDIYWHSDVMFQYESFQEARFVFDPQVREMMTELEKGGFSVPVPKEIRFGARDGLRLFEDWARFCRAHSKGEASAQGQGNGYSELFSAICDKLKPSESITDNMITYIILVCLVGDDYREHPEKEDAARAGRISEALEKVLDSDNAKENFDKLKEYLGKNNELAQSHTELVDGLVKIGESKEAAKLLTRSEGSDPWCSISLGENSSQVYRLMNELVEKYRAIKGRNYFLVFEWGMSSGEKNMLRMLAQLWYLPSKISETMGESDANEKALVYNRMHGEMTPCKTLFLFLDEADLTYHPEWQRRFISVLTAVIEKMFPGYGLESIQVILATHSPLMLGDFPAASTIYLKKSEGGMTRVDDERRHSTFGENLYTILDDSFFMNDTIGEFAKRKIDRAAEWCGHVRQLESDMQYGRRECDSKREEYNTAKKNASDPENKTVKKKYGEYREAIRDYLHSALLWYRERYEPEEGEKEWKKLVEDAVKNDPEMFAENEFKELPAKPLAELIFKQLEPDSEMRLKAEYETHCATMRLLPPGIIRKKMFAELEECGTMLGIDPNKQILDELKMLEARKKELENKLERGSEK